MACTHGYGLNEMKQQQTLEADSNPDEISMDKTTQRTVRQYLESLKRSGLTHVPKSKIAYEQPKQQVQSASAPATAPQARLQVGASPASQPRAASNQPSPSTHGSTQAVSQPLQQVVANKTGAAPVRHEAPPDAVTQPQPTLKLQAGEGLSREQRSQQLAGLASQVAQCTRCRELAAGRTQTVFGVGNPEAKIMFVGEAPGADEDAQGEPFVGQAGQLLNKIIAASGLVREELYICNILRCRPPGNRNPTDQEAANCREYLDGQIATICPEYIVCWGSVAAKNLLNSNTTIGRLRGKFHEYGTAKVLCTYHPSYLLRNPSAKTQVWEDMKFLRRDMGVELDK